MTTSIQSKATRPARLAHILSPPAGRTGMNALAIFPVAGLLRITWLATLVLAFSAFSRDHAMSSTKDSNSNSQPTLGFRSLQTTSPPPINNFNSSNPSDTQHNFPSSEVVLDMATLSHAVYHLRNKVQSCDDAQARNKTLFKTVRLEQMDSMQKLKHELGSLDDSTLQLVSKKQRILLHQLHQETIDNSKTSPNTSSSEETNMNYHQNLHQEDDDKDIFQLLLPTGTTCLHYSHDYSLGRQVLIVRSDLHNYVAVSYAGTDDWKTALTDGDILTGSFGPDLTTDSEDDATTKNHNSSNSHINKNQNISKAFGNIPEGVRVHRGFNNAVFDNDGLSIVLDCITSARVGGNCSSIHSTRKGANTNAAISMTTTPSKPYQLFTTGHSLGAANSILLGTALHLTFPLENIQSINFGCPKVGNLEWSSWIDQMQPVKEDMSTRDDEGKINHSNKFRKDGGGFEIFRFVNKIDLIPRLPELVFQHAGHTLQMSVGGKVSAYYDHFGNEDLGYSGVPFGWGAAPYAFLPAALASHPSSHYLKYLEYYRPGQNSTGNNDTSYFVRDFERIGSSIT